MGMWSSSSSLVLFLFCGVLCTAEETTDSSSSPTSDADWNSTVDWTHKLSMYEGFELKWTHEDPTYITFEMTGPGRGYVSIGFSPNGGMKDSDIVMGWVDDKGEAHIMDLYGIGNTKPKADEVQNYELLGGQETANGTTIRFRRKWNTCDDQHDMKLDDETVRIIWAFNEVDPKIADDDGVFRPPYHFKTRGVRRTFLKVATQHAEFPDSDPGKYPNVKHWDVHMDNNTIDKEDDVYFCKVAKFPRLEKKHQMIGFRPLLEEANKYNIHHIFLSECRVPSSDGGTEKIFEQHLTNPGVRCYTKNMPAEWSKYCIDLPILWTAGSEGNMLPTNVGSPLGEEHGGTTYFLFEIHYDNPQLTSFTDNSGFRIFYTPELREFDQGSVAVGSKVSPFHVIPPGLKSFTSAGFCPSECTAQAIPKTGITVTTVLLHAHQQGRKVMLRHFRDGKELEPIAQDNHYDYNYQQARVLMPTRQILPGDELLTVCEYDSENRTTPAFGGLGTRDEMCMSFVYYYPKINFAECKSLPEYHSFLGALGIIKADGEILNQINMPYEPKDDQILEYPDNPFYLKNGTYDRPLNALDALNIIEPQDNETVGEFIRNFNWADLESTRNVEKKWLEGEQYAFCTGGDKIRIPLKNYVITVPYEKYEAPKDDSCPGDIEE